MLKKMQFILTMTLVAAVGIHCQSDPEPEPMGCGIEEVSFSSDVQPIFQTSCLRCHSAASNFGNVTLQGYENVLKYVNNGKLVGAIQGSPGFVAMPLNEDPLEECAIETIVTWVEAGAPNN